MIFPRNIVLLVIAAVLGALALVPSGGGLRSRDVGPLFPEFDGSKVTAIEIGTDDAVSVRLVTADDGATWTVETLHGVPAFAPSVTTLVSRIGSMTTLDLVGDADSGPDEFGLADGVTVSMLDADGNPHAELRLADAGGAAVFVRAADDAPVYRMARMPLPPTDSLRWFDGRSIVPLGNLQLVRVEANGEAVGEAVTMSRPPGVLDGRFRDASGKSLSRDLVDHVLRRLETLFPSDVLGPAAADAPGIADPELTIEVTPTIGEPFRIDFASGDEAAEPWSAHRMGNGFLVAVPAENVTGLIAALRAAADSAE